MVSMVSPFQELEPCAISCTKKICRSDLPVPLAPRARTLYFQKLQEKDRGFGGIIPRIDTRDKDWKNRMLPATAASGRQVREDAGRTLPF